MTALVLAAGEGSRLLPLTAFTPKPLLPVGGRPMVEGIVRQLAAAGCRDVVVATTGRDLPLFRAALGDGGPLGVRLRYDDAAGPLGKAGQVCHAAPLLAGCGDFVCIHGDLLANLDLFALWRAHRSAGRPATVVVSDRCRLPVGVVRLGPGGRVEAFEERPNLGRPASIGLYVFAEGLPARMRTWAPPEGPFELGRHVFPRLAASGELGAHAGPFPWLDVGTVEAYRLAHRGPTFDGAMWPVPALRDGGST